jgi:hypothetical protein
VPSSKDGSPSKEQVRALGYVHPVGNVGRVFLYAETAAQPRTQQRRVSGHQHPTHPLAPHKQR